MTRNQLSDVRLGGRVGRGAMVGLGEGGVGDWAVLAFFAAIIIVPIYFTYYMFKNG